MSLTDTMTDAEKERYAKYLEQAKACGEPLGMWSARDSNTGNAVSPSNFLLKSRQDNTYTRKIDAVFQSKQK